MKKTFVLLLLVMLTVLGCSYFNSEDVEKDYTLAIYNPVLAQQMIQILSTSRSSAMISY